MCPDTLIDSFVPSLFWRTTIPYISRKLRGTSCCVTCSTVCPAQPVAMSLDEDARWLEWVTKQFESIAGDDKEIDLDEFKTALKVKEVSHVWAAACSQSCGDL